MRIKIPISRRCARAALAATGKAVSGAGAVRKDVELLDLSREGNRAGKGVEHKAEEERMRELGGLSKGGSGGPRRSAQLPDRGCGQLRVGSSLG